MGLVHENICIVSSCFEQNVHFLECAMLMSCICLAVFNQLNENFNWKIDSLVFSDAMKFPCDFQSICKNCFF